MTWNPAQYLTFADERLRPGFDLLARVGALPAGPLFDLGCGTGAHARAIAARWPDRAVTGVDNSSEMLAAASAAEASAVAWQNADIAAWSPPTPAALLFSNATLHWLGDHDRLLPRLLAGLAPCGVLAVQMPRNFASPSHVLIGETARRHGFEDRLPDLLRGQPVAAPEHYYDLLAPRATGGVDLWETEYLHVLAGAPDRDAESVESPVLTWVRATALRPFLAALQPEEQRVFLADYDAALRRAYPRRADGRTLLPFRRIFLVARV